MRNNQFSLRDSLIKQGVTDERRIREHLAFVGETIVVTNGRVNPRNYRVSKSDPNGPVSMG